jgi:plasmid stabilization system protein ParE
MKSKRYRFHPEAKEDIREAVQWYRSRSPIVASEFRITISDAVRHIASAPQRWPKYLYGTRRFVLHRFPFSVVYLDDLDVVNIVAVAHQKRKPGYWKRRI